MGELTPTLQDETVSRGATASTKGAKAKCDRLFSLIVRSRGACIQCNATANLQTAHIISRRYSHTRCVLSNAFCACPKCHMRWTDHPVEFASFVLERIGQTEYQRLYLLSQQTGKVDWLAVASELTVTAKALGIAA